ncbi:hypothetical protein HQ394_13190 [Defluviicoccus vanus]|uniref:Uncharacterized protein n=1 Tax=Defluviicoccus vanus TaxID=111831 RepID=A0A7H1N326_9PROT|nr:hypothetical protein HQ394_13190 [Defluviicoccus vanus]
MVVLPTGGRGADDQPVTQAAAAQTQVPILDRPVTLPARQEPEQVPSVQTPVEIHRPASVSDAEYAAEKAAAETLQAPTGAVQIPLPPRALVFRLRSPPTFSVSTG